MENLPTPLSRVELYLAKACGMDVTVPEQPLSRLEQFLAILAGDTSITMPAPASLTEQWLAYVLGVTPEPLLAVEGACLIGAQKVDVRYFARAAGMPGSPDIPEPQNRTEQYWYQIASNVPIVGFLKYATGIEMTLTDILSGIEELQFVYGDTFQQTYSGKNLFNINDNSQSRRSSKTIDGNKLTVTCTTDGTAYTVIELPNSDALLGKTCQLKVGNISVTSGSSTTQGMIRVLASLKTNLTDLAGDEYGLVRGLGDNIEGVVAFPNSYPDGKDCFVLVVYVGNRGGSTVVGEHGDYEEIQLELGSTATSYEPYVGGIPAPNPDYPQDIQVVTGEQTVMVSGKNAWNMNSITTNSSSLTITKIDNIYELHWTGAFVADLALANNLNSTKTYTLSFKHKGAALTLRKDGTSSALLATNTDSDYAEYTYTFTNEVSLNLEFIRRTGTSNVSAFVKDFQIEQGLTATAYEPYQGQSYPISLGSIELCKIGNYQDYIYKSGDDWYIHKENGKVVLDGTEAWTLNNVTTGYTRGAFNSGLKFAVRDGYCNLFTVRTGSHGAYEYIFFQETSADGAIFIQIKTSHLSANTLPAFKDWLSLHNVTAYYTLATPTDTKITDATLVGQLEALDSAVLPKPNANITVTASDPNLPGAIKISYYTRHE